MPAFKTIRARAAKRKGGEAALASLLPKVTAPKALARLGDDRMLAEMAKRVFSAGFVWSVIDKKWPGFEAAFLGFEPKRLLLPARRVLGGPGRRRAHRAQPAEDRGRARERQVRGRHRPRARQLRQVPRRVAHRRPDRPARAFRQARLAAGRPHRPVFPALHRQGLLRHLARRRRLPARRRPRHRREPDLEEGPAGRSRTSSMPGSRRRACRSPTSRASAPCRSARTTTPRPCAPAATWTSSARCRDRAASPPPVSKAGLRHEEGGGDASGT